VRGMVEAMSGEQLRGWLAFAAVEPFGAAQADLRAGMIARTIAEPNRDASKRSEPFQPLEFVPWLVTEERVSELDKTDEERAAEAREGERQARIRALRLAGLDAEGRLLPSTGGTPDIAWDLVDEAGTGGETGGEAGDDYERATYGPKEQPTDAEGAV